MFVSTSIEEETVTQRKLVMKYLIFSLIFFVSLQYAYSQSVEVKVLTNKKEIAAALKKADEGTKYNKLYFAEDEKCRNLTRAKMLVEAETSCRLATSYVEKLPAERHLERSSAYAALAWVLILQRKAVEAIPLLNKSLEVGKPVIDDTDAETGERYFLLGLAHHQLGETIESIKYYTKAENTYRAAFKKMGDSDIREFYPKPIVNILEAHLILLKNAGMNEKAAKVGKRLEETKSEFAEFLID